MISLLASLAILSLNTRTDTGAEVNAELISGRWAIEATVDGKAMHFLVCSTVGSTSVSSQLSGLAVTAVPQRHTIVLGGLTFPDCPVTVRDDGPVLKPTPDDPPVGGVLAGDFLQNIQIGLDLLDRKWTIWRNGRLTPAEARDWVSKAKPWPNISGSFTVDEIQLVRSADGFFCPITIGAKHAQASIDLGLGISYIPSARLSPWGATNLGAVKKDETSNFAVYALPEFGIGSTRSWTIGVADPDVMLSENNDLMFVGIKELRTTRFLFDFPNAKLYRSSPPADVAASMTLTDLVGIPLTLTNGNLFVGPVSYQHVSPIVKALNGLPLVDISGYTASSIADILKKADPAALKAFGAVVSTHYILHVNVGSTNNLAIPIDRTGI